MSTSTLGLFLRHLALSEEVSRLGTASDHDLLAAYEPGRGQAAFAELMRRHGPMVLRTCRRVLGQETDAEDAFQATFVLLARKAGSISKREALGGWLHRVAYRMALKALTGKIRRRVRERQASVMSQPAPDPSAKATWNEIQPILDAELDALPEKARQLLIACYLQDKTHAEAATELGLPRGSVAWRLEQARALLAERLARRGIVVSAALLAVLLEESAKGAGVPAVLLVHTLEAARTFTEQAIGMASEHVVRLVKGGLAQMTKGSTHLCVALVGWLGLLGAGLLACQTLKAWPDQPPQDESPTAERLARERDKPTRSDRFDDPLPPGALARLGTVRLRHVTGVHSLAFTRDGKGLMAAGKGKSAQLWDTATGRLLRSFGDGRYDPLQVAALSPDGRILAGRAENTGDLCLWDVASGTLLRRLKADRVGGVVSLAFSPDGKTIASGDGTALRLWETATGKELRVLKSNQVRCLAFSADGKTLIWADHRGDLHRGDTATGEELRPWDIENKRPIFALVRSPNGRLLAVYGTTREAAGGLARLWDVATGKEVWHLADEEGSITAAAFSPDDKVLATGHYRGPIRLWDAATGKELRRCSDAPNAVQCLAFSPDSKTLASDGGGGMGVSQDQTVHLWDAASGREIRRDDNGHRGTACSVAFTPDGKDIVSSGWEGSVRVWDAATGEQRRQALSVGDEHFVGGWIAGIASALSADGKTLISAQWERIESKSSSVKVRRWDRENGRELPGWSRELGNTGPYSLVFSPDGKTVACMIWNVASNQMYLWETATGKELSRFDEGYPAFSADGKLLATAPFSGKQDDPGSFTLWEAGTAKKLCSGSLPEGRVHRLLFSPDGRMLATASHRPGSQQSAIHLWPLLRDESRKSGMRVGPPRLLIEGLPSSAIAGVTPYWFGGWAFSPDGRTLALSGVGGSVRLLEMASGKERARFIGHGGDVTALSFSPDGRRLASGSRDTTLLVWDVTGRFQNERFQSMQLSAREIEKLWDDLASSDASRAGRAVWALTAAPTLTVPFLAERLQSAPRQFAPESTAKLIRDLDDDSFAVRQKAQRELRKQGEAIVPALRRALEDTPSPEMRRRLEDLLTQAQRNFSPSGDLLRCRRAVEALEQIGTREARQVLETLTAGAAGVYRTHEAQTALERLDRGSRR